MVRSVWGGKGRRGELHSDRAHGGVNGGGKLLYMRGEGLERPFIGKRSGKREARQAGLGFGVATGGDEPQRRGGDRDTGERLWQRTSAVARGQGANRGGARAVDRQEDDAWTGEAQEMAGGGQDRCSAPAAEAPGEQSRGGRGARRKKGEELNQGLICEFREKQGPH
jgi:hypothetical protein